MKQHLGTGWKLTNQESNGIQENGKEDLMIDEI